jgi:hypothetical protein
MRALENAEVVALDALRGNAPTLFMVITTPLSHDALTRSRLARRKLHLAMQARWPACEWACILEFTTGEGTGSGGKRRPHWNYVVKGVPTDDLAELRALVLAVWCPRMEANSRGQHVGELREVGGLMRYLVLHFHKPGQAPPDGYTGHRFTFSRPNAERGSAGYFGRPMPEVREEARASLRFKRHMHAVEALGLVGEEALYLVEQRIRDDLDRVWQLVREQPVPTDWDAAGQPVSWTTVDVPLGAEPRGRVVA